MGPMYYTPIMCHVPCQALQRHSIQSSQQSWGYEVGVLQIRELRFREVLNVRIMIHCLRATHWIGRWGR